MRAVLKNFQRSRMARSDIILRLLPQFSESREFERSYKQYLSGIGDKKDMSVVDAVDTFNFPYRYFKKYPRSTVSNLVNRAYENLKFSKATKSVYFYNSILSTFLIHEIDFDLTALLADMKHRSVEYSSSTYGLLICLYCERKDMVSAENLFCHMKSIQMPLSIEAKIQMYGGYIRTKQFEQATQFTKDLDLDENGVDFMFEAAKSYASIGYFHEAMNKMDSIAELYPEYITKLIENIYPLLVKAKVTDSQLDRILIMIKPESIANLIFALNRNGFYKQSYDLLTNNRLRNIDRNSIGDIVISFNNTDCPVNIYKEMLILVIGHMSWCDSLFASMTFDDAYTWSLHNLTNNNRQSLFNSLLTKAANTKKIGNIEKAFLFGIGKSHIIQRHTAIQFILLPAMIENGIISRAEDILELWPNHRTLLLQPLLFHFLCMGDFASYQLLLNKDDDLISCYNLARNHAARFLNYVPFGELKRLASEASKAFRPKTVNNLLSSIVIEKASRLSKLGDIDSMKAVAEVAKDLCVELSDNDTNLLQLYAKDFLHIYKQRAKEMGN